MIIATLNIDWAKKYSSKTHIHKIEKVLTELNADILIITENVQSLSLPGYQHAYHSQPIPPGDYEEFEYDKYLPGHIPVRTSIYSKSQSLRSFPVSDLHTSICRQFALTSGTITIYATIVGTRFNKMPYAGTELNNCITDCLRISKRTNDLCLAGDLNTSFIESEKGYEITHLKSRAALLDLCERCSFSLTTKDIPFNIDHILLPALVSARYKTKAEVFVEMDVLSDHKGIVVTIEDADI